MKIEANLDLSKLSIELAIVKSKINSINYAIGLLLNERQKEKVTIVDEIFHLEQMIQLFENASDYDEKSILPEHQEFKQKLKDLESKLEALK